MRRMRTALKRLHNARTSQVSIAGRPRRVGSWYHNWTAVSAPTCSTIESFTLVQRSAFPHANRCRPPPAARAILYYKDLLAPCSKALVWTHPVPYGAASGFLKLSHVPSLEVRSAVGGPPHHGRDQRLASAKITAVRRACVKPPGGRAGAPPRS